MNRPTRLTKPDALDDFLKREIELNGVPKNVYTKGSGPAVIVMHEMPGLIPEVARFARWICEAGFTIYMPSLFGTDGAIPSAEESAGVFQRACISAEFRAFAGNGSSPVTQWLRKLAALAHRECGGPGTGAIGMCFTGNFALSMMLERSVLAPVLSQPSLPLDAPGKIESPPEEIEAIKERLDRENLTVLAYRFEGDQFCQAQRFAAYQEAFGDRFIGKTLPDDSANSDVPPFTAAHVPTPHSVVTTHLIDREGEPTIKARDEIIQFFCSRLS